MGDFRNKYAKMARDIRVKALQAKLENKEPPSDPPRCKCGHTAQLAALCAWSGDNKVNAGVFCASCVPGEIASVLGIIE